MPTPDSIFNKIGRVAKWYRVVLLLSEGSRLRLWVRVPSRSNLFDSFSLVLLVDLVNVIFDVGCWLVFRGVIVVCEVAPVLAVPCLEEDLN